MSGAVAGTLRFLLAGAALPLAWGVTRSLVDVMGEIPAEGGAVVPLGVVAVIAGLVAQLAVWKFLPLPFVIRFFIFLCRSALPSFSQNTVSGYRSAILSSMRC